MENGAGKPVQIEYRVVSASTAMSACFLSRILSGGITDWTLIGSSTNLVNPKITFQDAARATISPANIFIEGSSSSNVAPSTQALYAYLIASTSGCGTGNIWTSASVPVAGVTYGTSAVVSAGIAKTPYSIGVLMTYAGRAVGLTEAAVQTNPVTGTEYLTSRTCNESE